MRIQTISAGVILALSAPMAFAAATDPNLPATGQVTCRDVNGAVIPCAGTGQDAAIMAGLPWPSPRFVDNGNGTLTDALTGLTWLKDANCFGQTGWQQALNVANTLAAGSCGLADASKAGDWRLPNRKEMLSLGSYEQANGATWLNGQGFVNGQSSWYWTSDSVPDTADKWLYHTVGAAWPDSWVGPKGTYFALPVRGSSVPPAAPVQ